MRHLVPGGTMTTATKKPSLRLHARALARPLIIAAAIVAIALAIFSVTGGRLGGAQGTSTGFLHRIDRLTALCGSAGGAPRCRRWRSG